MKHLKTLSKFNEANSESLSFETFKEILFDLSDIYECKFADYSVEDSDPFYDCELSIPEIEIDYPSDDSLSNFNPFDEPEEIDSFEYLKKEINEEIEKIEEAKIKMDRLTIRNKKVLDIITILETDITPRLKSFSNCRSVTFGYEAGSLRICFDIITTKDI